MQLRTFINKAAINKNFLIFGERIFSFNRPTFWLQYLGSIRKNISRKKIFYEFSCDCLVCLRRSASRHFYSSIWRRVFTKRNLSGELDSLLINYSDDCISIYTCRLQTYGVMNSFFLEHEKLQTFVVTCNLLLSSNRYTLI